MRRRADAIPDYTRNDSPKPQNQASTINVEVLLGRTIISGGSRSFLWSVETVAFTTKPFHDGVCGHTDEAHFQT